MQLESIKSLVKDQFEAMDDYILEALHSKTTLINEIGHHIIHSGGKRLRPLVLLLINKAFTHHSNARTDAKTNETANQNAIHLAAVIEFIHTATLLHDDVVDNSHLRRGKKTANSVWGNEAAVLVGDFLYSRSIQILTSIKNLRVIEIVADAVNTLSEGEVLQLIDRHNADTTEGAYLNIIRSKTAKLFEAAARLGAVLADSDPKTEKAIALYGMHIGTAFQLTDDLLDYQSSALVTGKTNGNDLVEGKVTLPLIHVLQNAEPKDVRLIKRAITEGDAEKLSEVRRAIETTGSIDYTLRFAEREAERAIEALSDLPESIYRDAASSLAQFAISRTY